MLLGLLEQLSDKVKACKFGLMARCMKAGGLKTRLMAKVVSFMPMVTSMMACGLRTRPTVMASIHISTALFT